MIRLLFRLLVALAVLGVVPAAAQSGTDIIAGRVTGPAGEPIAGAQVTAISLETGITRSAVTDESGRYTIVFPDGGGAYRLEAVATGMAPVLGDVRRLADEEVLIAHLSVESAPLLIEGLEVTAQRRGGRVLEREPGTQGRVLSGEALERLPIDPGDLSAIATLAPGVVALEGGDSIGLAFSFLGQGPSGNHITLDGLTFGGVDGMGGGSGMGVPSEAVRFTRVITNSYDVARGQFSGGLVATSTRGGTNDLSGRFTYSLSDPALQWTYDDSPFGGGTTQSRLSGGIGGPILKDRLFYFAALSAHRRSQGLASLLSADPQSLLRLGVEPDSVTRLLSIAAGRGIYDPAARVPEDQETEVFTALARVDYNLTDSHTLTLRGDARRYEQDAFRAGALGLPQEGGVMESTGTGVMASLTSRFGNGWVNEVRAYASRDGRESQPYAVLPAGRVRVSSTVEDGARSVSTLSFGGGGMAIDSHTDNFEISNELSLLLGLSHRVRAGAVLTSVRSSQELGTNPFGTFTFQSLEDFAANRPSSYSRMLALRERAAGGLNAAVYLGDTWRPVQPLQITYGVRAEGSTVYQEPELNDQVERLFGRRTDAIPSEISVTPRVGFSYVLPGAEANAPLGVVRGGIGAFRATPPWQLYATARDLTGLPNAQAQLICVGRAVPAPEWESYLLDPLTIPESCLEGGAGDDPREGSGRGGSVALFDEDFRASSSWRASLGFQRRIGRLLGASVDLTHARGVSQQGIRDLNLDRTPEFLLEQEDGRPVYVPESAIVPRSGEVGFFASRIHADFGEVFEVHSELESRSTQVSLGVNGFVPRWRLFLSGSYSWTRSENQGSGGGWGFGRFGRGGAGGLGSLPETAGDPNDPEWATSDFERRHSLTATLGSSLKPWLDFTLIGRATSGSPFTPLVARDINGDGARNDLAFVFDPAVTSDATIAAGISRLLEGSSGHVVRCLEGQLGQIAERNSCFAPWEYSLDLRLNLRPELPRVGRRLTVAVDASNTLAGIDRLLHGEDALRGWGQRFRPDATLLYPRGFDPVTRSFEYEVNETFGDARSARLAFRNPFEIRIQAQVSVGPERGQRGGFGGVRGRRGGGVRVGGPGGFGGPGGGDAGMDPAALVDRAFPNPIADIVALRDSLNLSDDQVERLTTLAGELQQMQDSLSASVREALENRGDRDTRELMQSLQPVLAESQENVREAMAAARALLTEEQWESLPQSLRAPRVRRR